jgi:hypothetical protein
MAKYTLALKDGSSIQVEAPDNASDAEILQRANRQLSVQSLRQRREGREAERQARLAELEAMRPAAPEEESGFLGDLAGGFASGVVGLGEMGALGAATMLDEEAELAARERIQGLADTLTPSMGDEGDLTYKVGQAFGSIAGAIGVGAAATYGAAAAGVGAVGAGLAGLLGAGTIGVAAGAGEASERAREYGATEAERNRAARIGAAIGSTEALPLGRVFGPIANRLVRDLGEEAVQTIGGRITRAARTGGEEAAQEAAANIMQNLNERGYNAEQAILEGAGEAGAIGGGAGAAVQILVDTFVGRRAPGTTAPAEAPQAEPLGLPAPEGIAGLIPDQRASQARAIIGQVLDERGGVSLEEMQGIVQQTQIPLPQLERVVAEEMEKRGAAMAGRAQGEMEAEAAAPSLEPRVTPRMEQAVADARAGRSAVQADSARREQEVQAAAREREALRAAGRGDEAAFEQPDLFALQLEQERRRLGPEELRRPDQYMDVPEDAEVITPEEPAAMGDLVEMADQRQRAAREDAEIADQLAAIEAESQATRAASDLETITGQQETQRQQATEQGRRKILQDVIEKTPSRNYNRVSRVFEDALAKAGYKGDRAKATEAEVQSIQRAVNFQRAERPAPEVNRAEPVKLPPEATQLQSMEARIPEAGTRRTEGQPSLPGLGRKQNLGQAPARPAEPQATPNVVTDAMLDEMGIAPKSAVRQRLRGKDLNDPTTRQILTSFANKPRTPKTAELGISRTLAGVPAAQPDLFAPRGARRAPQTEAAPSPVPASGVTPQQNAAQQLELFPETEKGVADVTPTPVAGRDRTSPPRGGRGVAVPGGVGGRGAGTRAPAAPKRRGLGASVADTVPTAKPAAAKRPALKPAEPAGQKRPVLPVLEVGKRRTEALAPKPKPKATSRTGETKASVEAKLLDAYDANTSADHKRFVKAMKVEPINDPMTIEDKSSVLKVLNTKSSKALKTTVGAIKKYLGAYEDPIQGLQDAIDDVVSQTPNFRSEADTTASEKAFFGSDNKNYLPARGKNSAQAVLDWAADNMSAATKRWMAITMRDAKANNTGIEAFQSTDLVAKRRELEKLFKDGFDPNVDADAKALEKLMQKLGIDESDPMLLSMMYRGSLFSLQASPDVAPLTSVVKNMLRGGDLAGALRVVSATSTDPEVSAVAAKLAKMVGDTKVKVGKSLEAGALGKFSSADNTISLLDGSGLNVETLLHEMTHAATVATLANKGHPLTRKLQKIFDEAREYLPTAYGSTTLEEFVAEAFSNPQFQTQLAGLKIKGEPLTPFAKFKAAISNFLRSLIGKPVKPVESALEQTTSLIDNILAPAPDNLGTGEFFMLSPRAAGKRVADMLDGVQQNIKPTTKKFRQDFSDQAIEFLRGTGKDKAKRAMLGLLPSQAVADVADRAGITGAMDLHVMMEEQRGAINKADQEVEGVLESVSKWVKAHKDQVDALNRVVYKSTIEQVDPTKPVSAYANDPEKAKAWKAMRNDWRALSSTGGDKIYAQMRDTYKKQYERMRDVIYGKIDETITDEAARKKLKNEVYARLFETGTIEPYFPLTRSGNYWLSYVADGEFTVEAFETLAARDRAIADLKADKSVKDVEKFVNVSNANFSKAPPSSFVGQTLQTLQANKVPQEVQAEIMRMFVEALPETSFAKSLQRRKGTAGYQEDAIHALKTKAFDLARQVERLRYSAKIRDLQDRIQEENATRLTDENKFIVDELQQRADFARTPPKDGLAQAANRAAFVFTIGFNASSALVNLSQVPMFVYPMLGGKYGYGATGRAIKNASKLVTSSGFDRKSAMVAPYGNEANIKVNAMPSVDNYFELDANGDYVIRKDLELDEDMRRVVDELKPLVQMMAERGQLNRSLFADNLGVDSSGRDRSITDTVAAASAFMFHNVEVYNRQVTAITAYQLELDRLKQAEPSLSTAERQQKAAETALYNTQMTNGGSVLETAPRLGQKGIGRVAMMYKTYGVQMYYSMFKTVRDGIEAHYAGDKASRNIAMKQIAGVMGASFVLAGVVGMPLAREIMQLLDLFFFDEEEDDVETVVRKAIGEGFYKGPLTALLGVDLSSRIGLSGLILQANRYNHDASLEEDVFHYLGGPAWSVVSSYNRGFKDIMSGNMERGVETMLPAGVRNAYQAAFRFPRDEGILTRRGDPIMDDLSFGELAAKFIGFAPAEYTRTQEMTQQGKRIDVAVNTKRTALLRRYYVAQRMGDYSESRQIMKRIQEFNRRHPTARIDADSFRRSMRQHMETSARMYNGVSISPNMRQAIQESDQEWNQGWQLF